MERRRIVHSDLRVTNSAKWQCPVITQGYTSIPGTHVVLKSGGGDEAQQQCLIHGVVHFKRDRKYVMRSGRSTIAGFAVAVAKQFTPLRDASGRPLFQVPLTHAQQIQRGSGYCFVFFSTMRKIQDSGLLCCRAHMLKAFQDSVLHLMSCSVQYCKNMLVTT